MRDFILGLRAMRRRPLVSLTSAICLAIGVSASAAAWTLVDGVLLRPFGLIAPDRLVVIWETGPARNQEMIEVSFPNFLDWQREARSLASMAAFGSQHWPALARIGAETVPLSMRGVSATFFATLGVKPALGRDFEPSDARADTPPPLLLSDRLWRDRFGAASDVVGRLVFVDGVDHQVVGVMPRGFAFPDDPDGYVSVERVLGEAFSQMPADQQRRVGVLEVLARMRPEADIDMVRSELTGIIRALRERHASSSSSASSVSAAVTPLAETLVGRLSARLWIALAMAAAVWLLACGNVWAVRAAALRERLTEIAARGVLGASRARLTKELAAEQVPLVAVATLLALAAWQLLVHWVSAAGAVAESGVALLDDGGRGLALVAVLGAMTWILVAAIPAAVAARVRGDGVWSGGRVARRTSRIGVPLLFGQAALAVLVLTVAASAVQTFVHLTRIDVGFAQRGVTLIDVSPPGWKYSTPAESAALIDRLRAALIELPSVGHAAAVSVRPFRFGEIVDGMPVRRNGEALVTPDEATAASRVVVSLDYFEAMGQAIVEGRGFWTGDRASGELVAVISRTLAGVLFPGEPAVGQRLETFSLSQGWRPRLIVGIVADARYRGLERPSMEVYVPAAQQPATPLGSLVVSSTAPVTAGAIRSALRRVEPELAIERILTTAALLDAVRSPARLLTEVVTLLAAAGLLLLGVGMFGAVAGALRAALAEIAICQALGARPLQAARRPLRLLSRAWGAGLLVGLASAPLALSAAGWFGLAAPRGLSVPLAAAVLIIAGASLLAVAPVVWRARQFDPAALLRSD